MSPYHRNVLLEGQYAFDHVVWSYRSQLDQSPEERLTAEDICLADFASRASALVRSLIDEDNRRRGPQLALRPPSAHAERRLADAIRARRRARADKASAEANAESPLLSSDEPDSGAEAGHAEHGAVVPGTDSPSRMPQRRRIQ